MGFSEKRIAAELRRIANSLEFIALYIAKKENIMWNPSGKTVPPGSRGNDEVMHTGDEDILAEQIREMQEFMAGGVGDD